MYQFIFFIHVLLALCLVGLVLVQQGKGATMGAAFGAGASQTLFGSRGSGSFLFRITIGFAMVFFTTSIILNNIASHAYKQEKGLEGPPARHMHIPLPPSTAPLPANSIKQVPMVKQIPMMPSKQALPATPAKIPTRQ